MPLTGGDDRALRWSLDPLRVILGILVQLISAREAWRDESLLALAVGAVAGLAIAAVTVAEPALGTRLSPVRASALSVATITGVVLALGAFHDLRPGDPRSLVVILVLYDAALRHGAYGMTAAWLAVVTAVASSTLLHGDGGTWPVEQPLTFVAVLAAVAWPAACLSEQAVGRVAAFDRARARAEHRAQVLAEVLEASRGLGPTDPRALDEGVLRGAAALARAPVALVRPVTAPDDIAGLVHDSILADGMAVVGRDRSGRSVVAVSVGGEPARAVVCVSEHDQDGFTVCALEVLCAQARMASTTAATTARMRAEARREASYRLPVRL